MRRLAFFRTVAIATLVVCLALLGPPVSAALAQDTRVDLDPFIAEVMPYVVMLASAIVAFALAWITRKVHQWTGINIEAKHREAFQSALTNGARAAIARITPDGISVDVRHPVAKHGVDFVLRSVPDAVRYFGLTPDDIERHLRPKLLDLAGGK